MQEQKKTKNNFYSFKNVAEKENEVDLFISGEIMDDETRSFMQSWFGDDSGASPSAFFSELKENAGKKINLYIDSYGGDVFAASSIYSALKEHDGDIVVKITGIAASAASVIAMAGNKVLMSKTAVMMIHNPSTTAKGDHNDMKKAAEVLDVIKESIINAYDAKTGLSREEISDLMEKETWMDSSEAIEKGFCDGLIEETSDYAKAVRNCIENRMFVYNSLNSDKNFKHEDAVIESASNEAPEKNEDNVVENNEIDEKSKEQMEKYLRLLTK